MATATSKTAEARAQREAKAKTAAPAVSGPALPGGKLEQVAGKPATAEQKAKAAEQAKAASLSDAEKAERKAANDSVEVVEVESIPTPTRNGFGKSGPSKWAQRLQKVTETKTGKARIYEAPTPQTAHGTRYRLNKKLAAGEMADDLAAVGIPGVTFTLTVVGKEIYAEVANPA